MYDIIVYEVIESENLVRIHRYFHGLQNWAAYI